MGRSLLDIFGNRRELGANVREHKAPIGTVVGGAAALAFIAYVAHRYGKSPTPAQIEDAKAVMVQKETLLAALRDFEYERTEEQKRKALVDAPLEVQRAALLEFPAFVTLFRYDIPKELAMLVAAVCDVPACIEELDESQARALVGGLWRAV